MKVARKNTYYVYNAENGEFLGCGSRCDIRKYYVYTLKDKEE